MNRTFKTFKKVKAAYDSIGEYDINRIAAIVGVHKCTIRKFQKSVTSRLKLGSRCKDYIVGEKLIPTCNCKEADKIIYDNFGFTVGDRVKCYFQANSDDDDMDRFHKGRIESIYPYYFLVKCDKGYRITILKAAINNEHGAHKMRRI